MTSFISLNQYKIAYQVKGQGDVLVFIHGYTETQAMWAYFVQELSPYFTIVTLDLPGHGESDFWQQTNTMSLLASCVKAVLDELEIKECLLIGHSLGGYVALEFAQEHDDLLKGICLFHSHAAVDTDEQLKQRVRASDLVKNNKQSYIAQFVSTLFAPENSEKFDQEIEQICYESNKVPSAVVLATIEGMKQRTSKLDFLVHTHLPILFIAGKQDVRIPLQKIVAQAMLAEKADILILDKVGHMGFIEEKEYTLHTIKGFAQKIFSLCNSTK